MSELVKSLVPQNIKNIYHHLVAIFALLRYNFPSRNLTVIGVTGTDGKTTTSTLIYHLLKSAGKKVALITSVAAYIGNEKISTGFHVTSPDPLPLQKLLAKISRQGFKFVVLEVTSHGLDQHRLFGVNFSLGVLTNITHEHLDYHKTYQKYLKTKAKLFKGTPIAVLNQQDESFSKLKPLLPSNIKVLPYNSHTLSGSLKKSVNKKFPEGYNQLNATAAILTAKQFDVSGILLEKAIKSFPGIPGRMEHIKNKKGINLIIDFAHTPNSLEKALTALRAQTNGKLIAVYGSAGLRDHLKRPLMGQIGATLADEVILTAEDPRTESAWSIIDQMMSGVTTNHGHMHKIPDRQEAINFAVKLSHKGDTVGIFGKAHEQTMCFGKIEYPWSDFTAVKTALAKNTKN